MISKVITKSFSIKFQYHEKTPRDFVVNHAIKGLVELGVQFEPNPEEILNSSGLTYEDKVLPLRYPIPSIDVANFKIEGYNGGLRIINYEDYFDDPRYNDIFGVDIDFDGKFIVKEIFKGRQNELDSLIIDLINYTKPHFVGGGSFNVTGHYFNKKLFKNIGDGDRYVLSSFLYPICYLQKHLNEERLSQLANVVEKVYPVNEGIYIRLWNELQGDHSKYSDASELVGMKCIWDVLR